MSRSEFEEEMMNELDHVLRAQISEPSPREGLVARVDALLESHRTQVLRSTTGVVPAVGELARRSEGLEQVVRELALAVEKLAATDTRHEIGASIATQSWSPTSAGDDITQRG